jgi:hypothetical protein
MAKESPASPYENSKLIFKEGLMDEIKSNQGK